MATMDAPGTPPARPERNFIVAALPPRTRADLLAHAEVVEIGPDRVLHEAGGPIDFAYFPLTAVVSLVSVLEGGEAVEVATVGNEGMVGLPPLLGVGTATFRAVSQIGGWAHRVPVVGLIEEVGRSHPLDAALRRYAQAMLNQVSQTAACNCTHPVAQRLARWLLVVHDRVDVDAFRLGHGSIARMMGVRRATITIAAGHLQRDGLISYRRGTIAVVDRPGLEKAACGCYRVLRREFDRLRG